MLEIRDGLNCILTIGLMLIGISLFEKNRLLRRYAAPRASECKPAGPARARSSEAGKRRAAQPAVPSAACPGSPTPRLPKPDEDAKMSETVAGEQLMRRAEARVKPVEKGRST